MSQNSAASKNVAIVGVANRVIVLEDKDLKRLKIKNSFIISARGHSLMAKGEDSQPRGRGFLMLDGS